MHLHLLSFCLCCSSPSVLGDVTKLAKYLNKNVVFAKEQAGVIVALALEAAKNHACIVMDKAKAIVVTVMARGQNRVGIVAAVERYENMLARIIQAVISTSITLMGIADMVMYQEVMQKLNVVIVLAEGN
ncbi:MAG: hypothetical protein ACKVTZ_21850 [Bacteroidia bacterium]